MYLREEHLGPFPYLNGETLVNVEITGSFMQCPPILDMQAPVQALRALVTPVHHLPRSSAWSEYSTSNIIGEVVGSNPTEETKF